MSLVLSSARRDPGQLELAISNFCAILSDEQRRNLHLIRDKPNADSIFAFTAQLDSSNTSRKWPVASRIATFLSSIQGFCGIVETFVSSHPEIAALVWGSIKLTMQVIANYASYFDAVSELFMEFGPLCPLFTDYEMLYPHSKRLQETLLDFHASVIRCCQHLMVSIRRSSVKRFFRAFKSSFDQEFQPDKDDIRRYSGRVKDAIDYARTLAADEERKAASKGRRLVEAMSLNLRHGNRGLRELQLQSEERSARHRKAQLLTALCDHRPERLLKQNQRKRYGTTTSWVFETPEFCAWIHPGNPPLLWCSGKIGSGKSVIAARVVDYFFEKGPSDCPVFYFFVHSSDQVTLNAETIMRSILRQILSLPVRLTPANEDRLEKLIDDGDLDNVVQFIIHDITQCSKPTYIVIDGLDECEQPERLKLLEALSTLVASTSNTKLFLASRDNVSGDIQKYFSSVNQLSINNAKVEDDIATYIDGILEDKREHNELRLGVPSLIDEIKKTLNQGADGMFLWVFFQVEEVCKQPCDEDIRQTLATLPRDLEETFRRLFRRILSQGHGKRIRDIFPWIAASARPLTLDELREAIAVEIDRRDIRPELLYNDIDSIALHCENLVHVDEEDRSIQFAHHSIKQFFLHQQSTAHDDTFYIDVEEADHFIGEICVTYLNLNCFNRSLVRHTNGKRIVVHNPIALASSKSSVVRKAGNMLPKRFTRPVHFDPTVNFNPEQAQRAAAMDERNAHPFINYASSNWIVHTKRFHDRKSKTWRIWKQMIDNDHGLAKKPWEPESWNTGSPALLKWAGQTHHYALMRLVLSLRKLSYQEMLELTLNAARSNDMLQLELALQHRKLSTIIEHALPIAAKSGHENVLNKLLEAGAEMNARVGGHIALEAAAENGHRDVVNRLLEVGADVNAADEEGRTALQAAAGGGYLDVVNRLLEFGADVNAYTGISALRAAAEGGHLDVVNRLLEFGAYVNAFTGISALQTAAEGGHLDVVNRLLEVGADVYAHGAGTALLAAAKHGHLHVVIRLLEVRADTHAGFTGYHSSAALLAAAENGHRDVASWLLEAGADANAADGEGRTALQAAAGGGYLDVVNRLLEFGAYVNAYTGISALQAAAEGGYLDVVNRLFEVGADVYAHGARTALLAAAKHGHLHVVNRLLVASAGVNATDEEGRTALLAAAEGGHLDVVNRLLEAGADTDAYGARKALLAAAKHGHLDVVKSLIETGVDVNILGGFSALLAAVEGGRLDLVNKIILMTRVDVNDYGSRKLLEVAARGGHLDIVNRLLLAGADVNAGGRSNDDDGTIGGYTALQAAAAGGHLDIVNRLLKAKADVNAGAHSKDGYTALQAAAEGGHLDVVNKLLKAGANITTSRGYTPLQTAAKAGHLDVVNRLLLAMPDDTENASRSALHLAAERGHIDVVNRLLETAVDFKGTTSLFPALQAAAKYGHLETVSRLLVAGFHVDIFDQNGRTALHYAAEYGHIDVVERLLEANADVNAKATPSGQSALHLAAIGGHLDVVNRLLVAGANVDYSDINGCTAIECAVQHGHLKIVNTLLEAGVDVNAGVDGRTVLQVAATFGPLVVENRLLEAGADVNVYGDRTALRAAAQRVHLEVVKRLLVAGANVNAADFDGSTALHTAAQRGHLAILDRLLVAGANVNATNNARHTALHIAVECGLETVKRLLVADADANATGFGVSTAVPTAAQRGYLDIIERLLVAGANVNAVDARGYTALRSAVTYGRLEVVERLLLAGANVNAVDARGYTALHTAVGCGRLEAVERLLVAGADANAADETGNTALLSAVRAGHLKVVERLLVAGADVNATNNARLTALHTAAYEGRLEIVERLLVAGADVNAVDEFGYTALKFAERHGHRDVVKRLQTVK